MSKNYFNRWEFQQAFSLSETDPEKSKILLEEYLEKYPKDYSAYTYYSSVLIKLGDFSSAEKILDFVEFVSSKDGHFASHFDRVRNFEHNILYSKLQLLSYQEKYEELYKFCLDNFDEMKDRGISRILFYSKKKNKKINLSERENNSYLFRQIIKYKEEDFLEHIQKHLANYNDNVDEPNKNVFSPDFPINEIIKEIKKYIPSEKRLCSGFIENVYTFKYNECGRDNNKLVDYFQVVCFHNTKEFITMYPARGCANLPCIDLNYLVNDTEKTKVKKISQIEKFNKKYKFN